jgi:hydrogenase nickel incorporation protein HypB
MCITCGCSPHSHTHSHNHEDESDHHHGEGHHDHHDHGHKHEHESHHAHAPEVSRARIVQIEQDILSKNDAYANRNRGTLKQHRSLCLNLVSSPGSGKTTLLCKTIEQLKNALPVVVVEGDQQTSNDADRIRATGAPAVQINTGKGCHLDAHGVGHALVDVGIPTNGVVFVENVGNLVCPADFDLGEHAKVVILSVTEGEDKPIKYPNIFANSSLMILSKIDLLPHVDFDVDACLAYARKVNPSIEVLKVSARSGEGMQEWLKWIRAKQAKV